MSVAGIGREIRTLSGLVLALGMVIGVALLLASYVAQEKGASAYVYDFLKDLGIVIAAVCAVHFVYEAILAEKYFDKFATRLREEVEKGETNVATCAALGIDRIFRRATFSSKPILSVHCSHPSGRAANCVSWREAYFYL